MTHQVHARRAGRAMEVTCEECSDQCTITEDLRVREDELNLFVWRHSDAEFAAVLAFSQS